MAFKTSLIVQSAKNFGYWQFVDDSVLKWLCEWCLFLFVCLLAIICIFEMCYSDCFHKCWNVTDHVDIWFWRWNETKIMEYENYHLRNFSTKLFATAKILQTCTISRKKNMLEKKKTFHICKTHFILPSIWNIGRKVEHAPKDDFFTKMAERGSLI